MTAVTLAGEEERLWRQKKMRHRRPRNNTDFFARTNTRINGTYYYVEVNLYVRRPEGTIFFCTGQTS